MLITKRKEVTKQGFCKTFWRKLRPRGSLLLEFIHSSGWGGGERLFEFDWEEEGVGAYLGGGGLALIPGWALIRINTVFAFLPVRLEGSKKLEFNCWSHPPETRDSEYEFGCQKRETLAGYISFSSLPINASKFCLWKKIPP